MSEGLMISAGLAAKLEECKKELGLTGDITDAQYFDLVQHLLKNYPESIDLSNPADRMFQAIAST